jgi:hypothetical protein
MMQGNIDISKIYHLLLDYNKVQTLAVEEVLAAVEDEAAGATYVHDVVLAVASRDASVIRSRFLFFGRPGRAGMSIVVLLQSKDLLLLESPSLACFLLQCLLHQQLPTNSSVLSS